MRTPHKLAVLCIAAAAGVAGVVLLAAGPLPAHQPVVDEAGLARDADVAHAAQVVLEVPLCGQVRQTGFLVAEYQLPVEGTDEFWRLLIGYDLASRAWFKAQDWDREVVIADGAGKLLSGTMDEPDTFTVLREGSPAGPDDAPLDPFLPMLLTRHLCGHDEQLLSVKLRHESGAPAGAIVRAAFPLGQRNGHRTDPDAALIPTTIEIDGHGRPLRVQRPHHEDKTFSYAGEQPEGFALADPAHGGGWRLVTWNIFEGARPVVFQPAVVTEFVADWWPHVSH